MNIIHTNNYCIAGDFRGVEVSWILYNEFFITISLKISKSKATVIVINESILTFVVVSPRELQILTS